METFRFGIFDVDLRTGQLYKRGVRVRLQDQPLKVLAALLEQPGEVVSREALSRRLWPQGTFVDFEHSLNAAIRRLRVALGDEAEIPRFVETVHKRGYRFIGSAQRTSLPHLVRATPRPGLPATIAHIGRPRVRLAVFPFEPGDGFTDGLTEEAVTQLAQCCPRTIGVIARTSVAHAQRGGASAADIGRALAADYRVEGHVRRDGNRIRITAQLIESDDETHVWATTFDRVVTDALTLQMEIAGEIAKGVTATLTTSVKPAALHL